MSDAFFGLPSEVKFCTRCVISNQRPRSTVEFKNSTDDKKETIEFNEAGLCEACQFHDTKEVGINWNNREKELMELCDKYRKSSGYDVVVPGSGGKDSAFTSHILKEKYGMNPLTVTWAPHLYTEIGWENFTNWIHVGGLDNILFTPNGRLHRYLTKEAFNNLLHPFQPFIVGQRIIGPMVASKFGIDLVMYGENQAEYGNAAQENKSPRIFKD
jgi:N-acetyl sugar amidotransferase